MRSLQGSRDQALLGLVQCRIQPRIGRRIVFAVDDGALAHTVARITSLAIEALARWPNQAIHDVVQMRMRLDTVASVSAADADSGKAQTRSNAGK